MTPDPVLVEGFSHEGAGIIRNEGQTYFVDGALPGELITFIPGRKRRGKLEARLGEILTPSIHRTAPRCQYFGICGGCVLQHIDPAKQISYKEKILFDNLQHIGRVHPENRLSPLTSELWHYRRKARLGVKFVEKKGGILIGFRERKSNFITSIMNCKTLDTRISRLLPGLHTLVSGLSNCHRIPQIEVATGDVNIALVFRHLEPLTHSDKLKLVEFADRENIFIYTQSGGVNTVAALHPESPLPLSYRHQHFDIELQFGPLDFIQINNEGNQNMVKLAVNMLDPSHEDHILDLFCGLGNFTLALAKKGARVIGMELDDALVNRGKSNARLNSLENVEFRKSDLYSSCSAYLNSNEHFNKVLLDPPRSGAYELIREIIPAICPERVVYISCNSATLARDSDVLVNFYGYRLTHAGAIDMFPGTAHIESIAVFERS